MIKKEVRSIAERRNLITAAKKDSTGICFIGKRDFREFLGRYIKPEKGMFKRLNGEVVGEHLGTSFYTIGQRRGLSIGGPGEAWFVVAKDVSQNIVYIEQGEDHPALYTDKCQATDVTWVSTVPSFPFRCTAKIRYRSADVSCVITKEGEDVLSIHFDAPQKAVTMRQAIVFYEGPLCLGGALIKT